MLRRHGSGSQTDCTRGYLSHNRMHHYTFFACFPLSVFALEIGRRNAAEDRIVKNILHFFFYWQTTSSLTRGRFWEFVFHISPTWEEEMKYESTNNDCMECFTTSGVDANFEYSGNTRRQILWSGVTVFKFLFAVCDNPFLVNNN